MSALGQKQTCAAQKVMSLSAKSGHLTRVLQFGDVEDIVRLVSPRALLLQATSEDVWSRGATGIFEHAEPAFPKGKLKLRCWPGGHVLTQEMREAAYRFLDEHLQRENKPSGM